MALSTSLFNRQFELFNIQPLKSALWIITSYCCTIYPKVVSKGQGHGNEGIILRLI